MVFLIIIFAIIFLASIISIAVRIEEREDAQRIEKEDLSADDFEITE